MACRCLAGLKGNQESRAVADQAIAKTSEEESEMKFSDHIIAMLLWFFAFWFAPAFLVNMQCNIQTRNAEQFLKGERCNWFKHHGKTYGCLCKKQRAYCEHHDRYETDETIQGWVQNIKELQ